MNATDKAFEDNLVQNLRRLRAAPLVNQILVELSGVVPRGMMEEAHDRLCDLLTREGAYVLTDYDRERAGLPARDAKGWTREELRAFEALLLNAYTRPPAAMLVPEFPGGGNPAVRFRLVATEPKP